jgi:beta-N-acetylhexosaminidase
MSMPHKLGAAARWLSLVSALVLSACAGIGDAPSALIAPRPTVITPSPSGTATAIPTAPVTIVIGVEATPTPCTTASILATWTVTRLAEQTVVVPVDENNIMSVRSEVAAGAGGVILFGSSAPTNLGAQLQALDAVAPDGIKPFIMTDEEGGVVQRMANLVGSIPSARQMGATMTPAQIEQLAFGLAQRMRAAGVTMDLSPVLDVDGGQGPNNFNADGTRSFSANVATASSDGVAFATGLRNGGIVPVVKHFPGLGGATGNTDVTAAATQSWSALQSGGLLPFEAAIAAHVPAVMVANATVPGLTNQPASVSAAVITGILRGRLGFQGLVITDSLSAVALSASGYTVPRAAVAALGAGADMVLYNADPSTVAAVTSQTVSAIVSAVNAGTLSRAALETAVGRVLAAKGVDLCP